MNRMTENKRGTGGAVLAVSAFAAFVFCLPAQGQSFIVKDGQPQAEIVISEKPTRSVKLAAREMQAFVQKISGASLPISAQAHAECPVKVYIGRSAHTDALKIGDEGLKYGAYKMVSGKDYLVLLGNDADFVPAEPWPRNPGDAAEVAKVMAEWDAKSGGTWGNPVMSEHRRYSPGLDLWEADGRGSLNAVYAFLQGLGARWYFPGDLGEILPKMQSIPLPAVNKTVRPDFPMRHLLIYYCEFFMGRDDIPQGVDNVLWQLRLGLFAYPEVIGHSIAHGIGAAHCRDEIKKAHPEYYMLQNGRRITQDANHQEGAPCLSSQGLLEENVKYVRAAFDVYHEPMVCVGPSDSYSTLCQCDLCKGKSTPERGMDGVLSDYVWDYVNRVAKEVYKTHPAGKVSCVAYSTYQLPPQKIETFSPNVAVTVCHWRSLFYDPRVRDEMQKMYVDWLAKLPSKELYIYDYYRHGVPGNAWEGVPTFFPHLIAENLHFLKGKSKGDFVEVYRNQNFRTAKWDAMAVNHLNCYVNAACLWNGDTNVDALLDEYYTLYYGPAAKEMRAFTEYAEATWMKANKDYKIIDRLLELIGAAQKAAGADTVYAKRVAMQSAYMARLEPLRAQLAKGRDGNPVLRVLPRDQATFKLDGNLDDAFWQGLNAYALRDCATGAAPQDGTSFRISWADDALYLGIECRDRDAKNLNITARKNGDTDVWAGDNIEILLETQAHDYYQIVVSPAGAIVNVDRKGGINTLWSSGAEAVSRIGDDGWTVEVRIPAAGEMAGDATPLIGVAGRKPTETFPWYFNLCRQRVRQNGAELSAFSPTGDRNFHLSDKFAKLYSAW